jgi:hypothetical protein
LRAGAGKECSSGLRGELRLANDPAYAALKRRSSTILQAFVVSLAYGTTGSHALPISRSRLLRFALQGALEGLIEGGFGLVVFRWRDLALLAFDFELEEFFF